MIDTTPLLRVYARWRRRVLAKQDLAEAQRQVLRRLLRAARATRFGRAHDFGRIDNVAEFQARVPLRRYEAFWRDWWQPDFPVLTNVTWPATIPYFALSSGTTSGTTKYIPVSRAMLASNRRAAMDILVHHLAARPGSRVLGGRNFMLGGSTDLTRQAPGVLSGDLSGIAAAEVPIWACSRFFPPRDVALIADWQRKMEVLAPLSLAADIRTIGGTPSWVLAFFARLAMLRPDLPPRGTSWFPNLDLFIHGGVNFAPYRSQFEALFAGGRVDMREVYPASEGFFAIADRGSGEGLRLLVDNGLFLEFVPADEIDAPRPTRHWLSEVQTDVNYAVVLSTNAGLWAYVLGDTVRFVELCPPRVLVTGRLSYALSAFGEHLIGEEIDTAMQQAGRRIGQNVLEYSVAAVFPSRPQEKGRHHFVVEFTTPVDTPALTRFAAALDTALAEQNADYRDHRVGMRPPAVTAIATGSFAGWMQQRGRAGGQNKVPRVIGDPALFASLLDYARRGRITAEIAEE